MESSLSFSKLWQDVKTHRRLYYIVLPLTFVVAAIISLSIPNYYNCTVKLAPEIPGNKTGGSLASLASSFGVNLGSSNSAGGDAIMPNLYPDLMNSAVFMSSLFAIPVTFEEDDSMKTVTYYEYLLDHQRAPWWSTARKALFKSIASLFTDQEEEKNTTVDPFHLTNEQAAIVEALEKKVVCDVDKKTMVITINVTDQNPVICATMADSVKTRLQKFITDYRTSKARVDLEYNKKLSVEAKARYEELRDRYVAYADSHRNVSSQTAQTKESDLQNEMQMQQQIYQQVVAQLQQAEMKVQQETPAFTTLQSATVPVLKAGPKRAQTCLVFLFLALLGTTGWILYKENDLEPLLGLS
jgi:uncharacterized protein involved in exopolysaccharide biosynthesis